MNTTTMKLRAFVLLCLFVAMASCHAQSANQSFDAALGDTVSALARNTWIIFQDKNNNYWFGSDSQGVFRFDGKQIVRFSTKDGLLNNQVRGIQEDKPGNIFITSLGGINKFDGQKFTTLPVVESTHWQKEPDDLWFSILGRSNEYGPYRYDGKTLYHLKFPKHHMEDEYYAVHGRHPWSPYEVYTIYTDKQGNIWFGTSNLGICRFDGTTLSWLYEDHLTNVPGGGSFGIRSIIEDKDGKFWFCNTGYRYHILPGNIIKQDSILIRYERERGIDDLKTPDGKNRVYFQQAVKGDNGDLWLATHTEGIWRYDGKNVTRYPVMEGAAAAKVVSIYKDGTGRLWLGTSNAGVYRFNGKSFEKFEPGRVKR